MLYREGIASALDWLASRASERFGIVFSFRATTPAATVPQDLAIVLFQCARELVYNVAKHAAARTATIELVVDDAGVLLTVTDDGKGFDASGVPQRRGGFGLFSIGERVVLFGGGLSVASTDAGSRVSVRLPLGGMSKIAAGSKEGSPDVLESGGREALR
jgi:signal transduction histidine kinase